MLKEPASEGDTGAEVVADAVAVLVSVAVAELVADAVAVFVSVAVAVLVADAVAVLDSVAVAELVADSVALADEVALADAVADEDSCGDRDSSPVAETHEVDVREAIDDAVASAEGVTPSVGLAD
jgi:hypothetical protein